MGQSDKCRLEANSPTITMEPVTLQIPRSSAFEEWMWWMLNVFEFGLEGRIPSKNGWILVKSPCLLVQQNFWSIFSLRKGKMCIMADRSLIVDEWTDTVKWCAPRDQPFADKVKRYKQRKLDSCLKTLCPIVKTGKWASRLGMGRKKAIESPWHEYEDGFSWGWSKMIGEKCFEVAYTTVQGKKPDLTFLLHALPRGILEVDQVLLRRYFTLCFILHFYMFLQFQK